MAATPPRYLRALMLGTDVIVLDPENEYRALVDTV